MVIFVDLGTHFRSFTANWSLFCFQNLQIDAVNVLAVVEELVDGQVAYFC